MKLLLSMLMTSFSIAQAAPSVACFSESTPFTVQLSLQRHLNDMGATLAEVDDDHFSLSAYMSNSEITETKFKEMISARKVDATVYPEGTPTKDGDLMHVSIEADRAVVVHGRDTYKFDSCHWQQ